MQVFRRNLVLPEVLLHFQTGAGIFLPENHGHIQKVQSGGAGLLQSLEGLFVGSNQYQPVFRDGMVVVFLGVGGDAHKAQVGFSLFQELMDTDAVAFQLHIVAVRAKGQKIRHDFRQQALAGNGGGADDQFVSMGLVFQILQCLAPVQNLPGLPVDQFAFFGQHHPLTGTALNQPDAQGTFQGAHVGADGGLGQE